MSKLTHSVAFIQNVIAYHVAYKTATVAVPQQHIFSIHCFGLGSLLLNTVECNNVFKEHVEIKCVTWHHVV